MSEDPQRAAWQYRQDRLARAEAIARGEEPEVADMAPEPARPSTQAERSAYVENAIQQAIRRGEFDNLPGAGKPLEGLTGQHDPDWWIRRKIEREQLTGLGPPAGCGTRRDAPASHPSRPPPATRARCGSRRRDSDACGLTSLRSSAR